MNESDNSTHDTINIDPQDMGSEIVFSAISGKKWVMKLTKDGIFFNREAYPEAKPYDFAEAVIHILETAFTVKFEKKEPPYDRLL